MCAEVDQCVGFEVTEERIALQGSIVLHHTTSTTPECILAWDCRCTAGCEPG